MKKTILVAFALVLATAAAAPAVTRLVPGEYATIQAAIDACNDGDAVIVQTGTYSEAINFNGKNIVVSSTDPNDPDTVAATVIAKEEENGVVVLPGLFQMVKEPADTLVNNIETGCTIFQKVIC